MTGNRDPAGLAFLRDECGARFMQFIPIVARAIPETFTVAGGG